MTEQDLSIATNPFLSERSREFWSPVEKIVQEEYGASSLPEYVESELKNQSIPNIASKLNVNYSSFYTLLRQIGIVPTTRDEMHDKKTALEQRIKQEHGIPLSKYTFRRYYHDMCNMRKLAQEYGVCRQTVCNWMKGWGFSARKSFPSPNKGKTYEEMYGAKKAKEIKAEISKKMKQFFKRHSKE